MQCIIGPAAAGIFAIALGGLFDGAVVGRGSTGPIAALGATLGIVELALCVVERIEVAAGAGTEDQCGNDKEVTALHCISAQRCACDSKKEPMERARPNAILS